MTSSCGGDLPVARAGVECPPSTVRELCTHALGNLRKPFMWTVKRTRVINSRAQSNDCSSETEYIYSVRLGADDHDMMRRHNAFSALRWDGDILTAMNRETPGVPGTFT